MESNNCITSTPHLVQLNFHYETVLYTSTLVSVNFNSIALDTTEVSFWGFTDITNARLKFV
jgi:hypothetical protein